MTPRVIGPALARRARRWYQSGHDLARVAATRARVSGCERRGQGRRAVRAQAELIRYVQRARESMGAYRRFEGLLARHGDADLELSLSDRDPQACVFFIGYSRSGHSLVGSLLDAHPNIAIAHEQHALRHLASGESPDDVLRALQYNSQIFERLGRHYSGYDYQVPGQYQGDVRSATVIGDKKGNGSARVLRRHASLPDYLGKALPAPPVFIHVLRNPFDNITTKAERTGRGLGEAARLYFANAALTQGLKERMPGRVVDITLEGLIADPRGVLADLVSRLGLSATPDYLAACESILFRRPSRTRDRGRWSPEQIAAVNAELARYPFLAGYSGSFRDG